MRQFRYQAKKGSDFIKGILFSGTKDEAAESISGMGFTLVDLSEEAISKGLSGPWGENIAMRFKKGRQCRRVASHLPLRFRLVEYHGASRNVFEAIAPLSRLEFQGKEKDIGLGGISFSVCGHGFFPEDFRKTWGDILLEEIFEPGSILELKMALSGMEGSDDCIVKVQIVREVYPAEATSGASCLVGAVFLPMDDASRQQLVAFCEARMRGV